MMLGDGTPTSAGDWHLARRFACVVPPRTGRPIGGGDLLGVQDKLSYIKSLNATAIWISPTNDNENLNANSGTPVSAPYHGYWNPMSKSAQT
jgi:glycosidase